MIDLSTIAGLRDVAPDMPLSQAYHVLKWMMAHRDAAGCQPGPVDVPSVPGGSPAPAAPVVAATGAPPSSGQPWTEEEKAEALRMRVAGATNREIADTLGRGFTSVQKLMWRLDPRRNQGFWSEADEAILIEEFTAGATAQQVAERLGRTPDAVMARAAKLGGVKQMRAKPDPEVEPPTVTEPEPPVLISEGPLDAASLSEVIEAPVVQIPAPIDPVQTAPAQSFGPPLSRRQQLLVDHLNRLPSAFTPEDDMFLIEQLASGTPGNVIADQLGTDLKTIGARFRAMQIDDILNKRGNVTLEGQQDLLVAVRYRAGCHA